MKATRYDTDQCKPYPKNRDYQEQALQAKFYDQGIACPPWTWFTPECGTENCLEPDHLTAHSPIQLDYPHRVCVYCGLPGYTRDHILPRNWSGETLRKFITTVPACGECNNLIGESLTWSITERRQIAHERLRRRYRRVLATVDRTPEELREYGPNLRGAIVKGMRDKRAVTARLEWPTDPAYDMRAMQRSGIDNPYAVGLLGELESAA